MNAKKELRTKLISEMEALNELAKKENRNMTDDESKAFAEKAEQVRSLNKEIEEIEARGKTLTEFAGLKTPVSAATEDRKADKAFITFNSSRRKLEFRTDLTHADGAAIAPEQFVSELERDIVKDVLIYPRVTKIPVNGRGSLGLPYEAADVSDAEWTAEVPDSEITADTSWKFGKRELVPHNLNKLIKFSYEFLETAAFPIDVLARQRLAERFAAAYENSILNGTGNNEPLGLFVASDDGIPSSRDVTTETAGTITGDDIMNVYMSLRPGYRRKGVWVMNTATLKAVMKLKDSNGQYLWHESLRVGEPSTLLGLPVLESEFAPTGSGDGGAFATGDYALLLGDLSHYKFASWKNLEILTADQKFAGTNQIGLYGHSLADGCPTLPNAFARLVIK